MCHVRPAAYCHSGDLGDVVYALPAVRAAGGGSLTLFPSALTTARMTEDRAALLAPLLAAQPYVSFADWDPRDPPPGLVNLDGWRGFVEYGGTATVADNVCDFLRVPRVSRLEAWLAAPDPLRLAPVVFARSGKARGAFPWRAALAKYHGDAVFVGLPEEHRAFEREVGAVPFRPTADFLELARVVAGAAVFAGNQSAPLTVAQGLGLRVLLEAARPAGVNCHWGRPGDLKSPRPEDLPDL